MQKKKGKVKINRKGKLKGLNKEERVGCGK
jgi:hypothetical protein